MSAHRERLAELLADRALQGLDPREQAEVDRLLAAETGADPEEFDRAAAAAHLSLVLGPLEPVPASLREKLERDARAFLRGAASDPDLPANGAPATEATGAPGPTGFLARPWPGWIAAAAILVLWLSFSDRVDTPADAPPGGVDLAGMRASLAERPGAVSIDWTPAEDELGRGVTGDVVWSDAEQRGCMRFENLAVNDPGQSQYQLWIFDEARSAERPVDGGVFDVLETGEVLVPIDAKLPVAKAHLFAITLERPGGVVVSTRERLLLTASVL